VVSDFVDVGVSVSGRLIVARESMELSTPALNAGRDSCRARKTMLNSVALQKRGCARQYALSERGWKMFHECSSEGQRPMLSNISRACLKRTDAESVLPCFETQGHHSYKII